MDKIHSIILVTDITNFQKYHSDIQTFFDSIKIIPQKDILIYSSEPVSDYTSIKKISADEISIIYSKDFFPLKIAVKPGVQNILNKKKYNIVVHFSNANYLRPTYLLAKILNADIKISNHLNYQKKFSVIIHDTEKYFEQVKNYLDKVII